MALMQNTLDLSFFMDGYVDADIRIREVGLQQRDLLIGMYDRFDPLGAALGLPPRTAEARCEWIGSALGQKVNVAAFSPAGEVVGHCFLVCDRTGSAEMAIFVHQAFRWNGTCEGGAGLGRHGGFAACVEHDRFRQQGRFAPANELWLPSEKVRFS